MTFNHIMGTPRSDVVLVRGDVVLVTGGAGFLGNHIVKLLQEQEKYVSEIRVFDRIPYENKLGKIKTVSLFYFKTDV